MDAHAIIGRTHVTLTGGLMVCGTTSDAGKSQLVAGLCRVLARNGVRVAPFKAQNMALNSAITPSGHEIGRAQVMQAAAAGIEPEVMMNPVLLKPTGERTSQVVVLGRAIGEMSAAAYHDYKPQLLVTVLEALSDLRNRFDVVLLEGAGSPTEINLLAHDIVNLRIAHEAGMPAIVVGDINLGGVFAALYGTVGLLPLHYRELVKGFVINKLRGDPALLLDGTAQLEAACGVPTLGVLPWLHDLALDAEDSLALSGPRPRAQQAPLADTLDIAVVAFPRLSNFTDVDPLCIEPGVSVRFVHDASGIGKPDLLILPGTKATVADLAWLCERRFDVALRTLEVPVLGICGGYQMLGETIDDPVESAAGRVDGLGLLPVSTVFEPLKVTRQVRGSVGNDDVHGYQIHHGRVHPTAGTPWLTLSDGTVDGVMNERFMGTTMHGLFESDDFRHAFLRHIAARSSKSWISAGVSYAAARESQFDRLADAIEQHVDMAAIERLISLGALGSRTPAGALA
jgi:adenosylcobyric acid synthase